MGQIREYEFDDLTQEEIKLASIIEANIERQLDEKYHFRHSYIPIELPDETTRRIMNYLATRFHGWYVYAANLNDCRFYPK
jgi:hypothetical protein